MSNLKQTTGKLIRQARKAQKLTQKELGERMGVSVSAVNRYESGKINNSVDMLERIADALNMDITITLTDRGE